MKRMAENVLYYGDNLDVLRRHIDDESVDLIYLDPPFNSNADYNVLFGRREGQPAPAQIKAFEDTWRWDQAAAAAFEETVEQGGQVSRTLQAFRSILDESDMLAYLAMMAPRLVELRRVLQSAGSIYLHCDPTASHYLKLLMDAVFGPENFLNEVAWKRTHSHGNVGRNFGSVLDSLLVFTKTSQYTWNQQHSPYPPEYIAAKYRYSDPDGRVWQSVTLRNPGVRPNLHFNFTASNGITYQPHPNGWACDEVRLRRYDREGRLHFPEKPTGALRMKMYLDESPGVKLQNLWDDIPALNSQAQERLGYPTQKPEALLERIIESSSNAGSTVLDPFCGCGTTVAVAEKLGRRWIGIDITHLAINLIKHRLADTYGPEVESRYRIIGEPVSIDGAERLAADDPYQFQFWALGLVGARPHEQKKGADRGIDGRLYFHDQGAKGKTKQIIISVKAGRVQRAHVHELRGVVEREGAQIGVLISFNEPTRKMREEAASAGFYTSPWGRHARLQLITIAELLDGRRIDYPATTGSNVTFKRAARSKRRSAKQLDLTDPE